LGIIIEENLIKHCYARGGGISTTLDGRVGQLVLKTYRRRPVIGTGADCIFHIVTGCFRCHGTEETFNKNILWHTEWSLP